MAFALNSALATGECAGRHQLHATPALKFLIPVLPPASLAALLVRVAAFRDRNARRVLRLLVDALFTA